MTERLLRMVQHGSPKRSTDELQSILSRLTDNRLHEKMLDGLRSKHIKEAEPNPLTADEQQEITDRVYYQQLMVQEERNKVLRSKYLPVVEREHVSDDHIQDMILRLHQPIERPELEPRSPPATVPKQKAEDLLKKLYDEDQKKRKELVVGLERKYLWGPAAPKRSAADIEASVKRLVEPISSTRQR
jgi:tRNA nucleotidyltransferase (CCA-adding enzyme)